MFFSAVFCLFCRIVMCCLRKVIRDMNEIFQIILQLFLDHGHDRKQKFQMHLRSTRTKLLKKISSTRNISKMYHFDGSVYLKNYDS